ncbi:hypothetical protein B0T13DRAFT_448890 [Neurospora crassa]|nr:hypothetical protein B0T13DRAFT_448890 [Neurospora crassa]
MERENISRVRRLYYYEEYTIFFPFLKRNSRRGDYYYTFNTGFNKFIIILTITAAIIRGINGLKSKRRRKDKYKSRNKYKYKSGLIINIQRERKDSTTASGTRSSRVFSSYLRL